MLSNSLIHTVTKNKPEVLLIKTTLQWTLDNNIQIHPHNLVINCTFSFVLAPLVDLSIFTTDKQCSTVPRSLASLKFAVCVKNKPLKQKVRDYEMQCVANNESQGPGWHFIMIICVEHKNLILSTVIDTLQTMLEKIHDGMFFSA